MKKNYKKMWEELREFTSNMMNYHDSDTQNYQDAYNLNRLLAKIENKNTTYELGEKYDNL